MQTVTTGLVLREVKVGEADRILTILSPELGVISASAKGSLRLRNKLFSACGLFCYSEFSLTAGRSTWFVDEAQNRQTFHGISESVENMALAIYLSELATALPPGAAEAPVQLRLLLNSLYLISTGKKPLLQIKAVFELRFLAQAGYLPDLLCCRGCGKYDGGDFYFDVDAGHLLCAECAAREGRRTNLDGGALVALRHICLVEDGKIFAFALAPAGMSLLCRVSEQYILHHIDKKLRSLEFLHAVLPAPTQSAEKAAPPAAETPQGAENPPAGAPAAPQSAENPPAEPPAEPQPPAEPPLPDAPQPPEKAAPQSSEPQTIKTEES